MGLHYMGRLNEENGLACMEWMKCLTEKDKGIERHFFPNFNFKITQLSITSL